MQQAPADVDKHVLDYTATHLRRQIFTVNAVETSNLTLNLILLWQPRITLIQTNRHRSYRILSPSLKPSVMFNDVLVS
jgi:hypothetical protein